MRALRRYNAVERERGPSCPAAFLAAYPKAVPRATARIRYVHIARWARKGVLDMLYGWFGSPVGRSVLYARFEAPSTIMVGCEHSESAPRPQYLRAGVRGI